jgi:hypothetical protein
LSYSGLRTPQMKKSVRTSISLPLIHGLIYLTERQLQENLQKWLSPPDPSTNHNIARKAHHKGTASWFFKGGIFEQWKLSSSLLWIHGKRTPLFLSMTPRPVDSPLCSGLRKKCFVVCYFLLLLFSFTQIFPQLWDNRRHHGPTGSRIGNRGLFLLRLPR